MINTRNVSMGHGCPRYCQILINRALSLTKGHNHTGQCKRTGCCYNELVVAFYSTGGGVKGKKIYTC